MDGRAPTLLFLALAATAACGANPDGFPGQATPFLDGTVDTVRYRAVGQIRDREHSGSCSGALVRTSDAIDAPAWFLTAGHCLSDMKNPRAANEVLLASDPEGSDPHVMFNLFHDQIQETVRVEIDSVAYATLKGTDIGLLRLDATVGALADENIIALPLATSTPALGDPIEVVGTPWAMWLVRSECALQPQRALLEAYFHLYDMHSFRCDGIYPGSSGSPVFDTNGEVFAVLSTGNRALIGECGANDPCEIHPDGLLENDGLSYAAHIVGLAECFDSADELDLARAGCPLDSGWQLDVAKYPVYPMFSSDAAKGWQVELSGTQSHFRYKTGPTATTDCRDEQGYTGLIEVSAQNLADLVFPETPDTYFMCVLAEDPGQFIQPPRFPTVLVGRTSTVYSFW